MTAEVELQRVAIMGVRSWEEFRAVCRAHGHDNTVPKWMAVETRPRWFDAKLDALEHNLREHRASEGVSWETLVSPREEESCEKDSML